jgi:hypothetical protein
LLARRPYHYTCYSLSPHIPTLHIFLATGGPTPPVRLLLVTIPAPRRGTLLLWRRLGTAWPSFPQRQDGPDHLQHYMETMADGRRDSKSNSRPPRHGGRIYKLFHRLPHRLGNLVDIQSIILRANLVLQSIDEDKSQASPTLLLNISSTFTLLLPILHHGSGHPHPHPGGHVPYLSGRHSPEALDRLSRLGKVNLQQQRQAHYNSARMCRVQATKDSL